MKHVSAFRSYEVVFSRGISLFKLSEFDSLTIQFFASGLHTIVKSLHNYPPCICKLLQYRHKSTQICCTFPILDNCSKSNRTSHLQMVLFPPHAAIPSEIFYRFPMQATGLKKKMGSVTFSVCEP